MIPLSVEDTDMLGLVVEHVDVAVIVHGEREDPAKEILLGAIEFTDRDFGDQGRFPLPDASRQGADDGGVADGLDDDLSSGCSRARVGSTGRQDTCRCGQQRELTGSHGSLLVRQE